MKKYEVTIIETLKYVIEVEADNEEKAEELAYESEEFTKNIPTANDSYVESVERKSDSE